MFRRSARRPRPETAARVCLRCEPLESRDAASATPTAAPSASPASDRVQAAVAALPTDDFGTISQESRTDKPLRTTPRPRFAAGSGAGSPTAVNVYDAVSTSLVGVLSPFGRDFTGGARVATGDLNGDGVDDIVVGAGPGSAAWVKVYDGRNLNQLSAFKAYADSFTGGVFVAAGDVTGDGRADIVTGAGAGGGPHVQVFDGADLFPGGDAPAAASPRARSGFFAFDPGFHGGVKVAVGDVNGDGVGDIVAGAGAGGGPHVMAFSGTDRAVLASFFAYDSGFRGGVNVSAGDVTGDGRAEILTGPMSGGGPVVRVFDGGRPVVGFVPFDGTLRSGVTVAAKDVDLDGRAEVIAATGPGTAPRVKVLDAATGAVRQDFPGFTPDALGGVYVG